jgi:uncharacterized YccA/Bax inhibitor family protein
MPFMKTSNPALGDRTFQDFARAQYGGYSGDTTSRMTLNGTVNKTGILLVCAMVTAGFAWMQFMQSRDMADVMPWLLTGMIGGFICAMITIFKKEWSPVTAPLYALLEGLVLGSLSAVFELRYPGIAIQAVGLTFGTLFAMLFLYRSGIIKVTDKFRMGVFAATGGIALFYFLEIILSFFHINFMGRYGVEGSGLIGIGFSLLVVGIAALNLVLNFDVIERGVQAGAPKYMEWYGAFGIMVTLIWLYLEILNLLAKLNRRN